jgi:hypothetical protein
MPPPMAAKALPYASVLHLIIIPNYMEDLMVLRETLYLLSTHALARTAYYPVLGFEAREPGALDKAHALEEEFKNSFLGIGHTLHPSGLVGEAPGKSSNLAWAIRHAWLELKTECMQEIIDLTVVTVIDSDSE